MTAYLQNIAVIILMLLIYIGIPAALISYLIYRKKHPKPKKARRYKVLSPLPILINVPAAFVLAYAEHTGNTLENEEMWTAMLCIMMLVTLVWSFIDCRLAGFWVGPLRFFLGAAAGIVGAAAVIIVLGLILVIGVTGGSRNLYISDCAGDRILTPYGADQYIDGYGNLYTADGRGCVRDVYGYRYDTYYS